MKKNQITFLTGLLSIGLVVLSVLVIIAYQNIGVLSLRQANYDKDIEQIKILFYCIFTGIAFLIIIIVLVLGHYNRLHTTESCALATLDGRVGVFSQRMDDILKSISDPFFALDKDYNFIFLNSIAANELTTGNGSLLGTNYLEKFVNNGKDIVSEKINEVMQTRQSVCFEAKDASGQWRDISVYPTSEGISVHSKDAAERKKVEEQLIKTRQIMHETNLVAMVGGWEVDLLANKVLWTDVTYLIHEQEADYEPDLEQGINYYKEGLSRKKIRALVQHTIETGEGWDAELQIITAKGNEKWVRTIGKAEFRKDRCVRLFGIFQDITLKKQADDRLIAERKLLQTIIDNLPMNVYVKDRQFRKVLVNLREKEYLQADEKEDLLGKDDYDLYPAEHAQTSVEEDKQVYETGVAILNLETVSVKFDGTKTCFLTSKIPYYDEQNHIEGLVGISYDITGIKEKESALEQLNTALEKATTKLEQKNLELRQFATLASHDLQEPLRLITGFISLLEKKYSGVFDVKGKEYLSLIVDGAVRMRLIISNILKYSSHDYAEEDVVKLDLNNVLNKLVEENFSSFVHEGAQIKFGTLPIILADRASISQLFANLICNALKYQPVGNKPVITISAVSLDDFWQFSVCDNGIGIKAEYFEKIFEIFRRLHSKGAYSGTGIGLAICKKVVKNYGGEIWVESVPGTGSTFYFTLTKKDVINLHKNLAVINQL